MKKPLAITWLVEPKEVRKIMAALTGDVLTDEDLEQKFFGDPIQVDIDILGDDYINMLLAFTALIADKRGYS